MSRVLLVGAGPWPEPQAQHIGFPQLRTRHFAQALASAGHELGLACLHRELDGPATQLDGSSARAWDLSLADAGWLDDLGAIAREWRPELWVTAGPHAPLLAAAAVGDEPLWADVPGDPFAEAQARAACLATAEHAEPLPGEPQAAQAAATMAALQRADAFSVCSGPQRCALLGQLGVLGRLGISSPERSWAHVVPPAWDFALPPMAPRERAPGSPLTVLLSGSFNTWFHDSCLLQGLLQAMDQGLPLRVLVTGGAVAGHHEAGWRSFSRAVAASDHASRFELAGWVRQAELPVLLTRAHLLLSADRPGAEPLLGSRTRLLFGLHQGLRVASTTHSELSRGLAEGGFLDPLPEATPQAVAQLLARLVADGCDGSRVAQAQQFCAEHHHPIALAEPLLRWVDAPDRAPAGERGAQQLAAELAATRAELSRVYGTPTWRLLSSLHGLLLRLLGRS